MPINGRRRGPNADVESTVSRTFLTTLTYAASPKLSFDLVLPYKDTYAPKTPGGNDAHKIWRQFSGMGDAILLARYGLGSLGMHGVDFQATLGIRMPTGKANPDHDWIARNGETIHSRDPVLQPGQGQWDPIVGARADGKTGNLNWFVSGLYRHSTGPNGYGYNFGSEVQLAAGGSCSLSGRWDASLMANFIHTDMDTDFRKSGAVKNTGGEWLYLTPGVRYRWDDGSSIELSVMIPVYRNTNGNILNPEFVLSLSSSFRFDTAKAPTLDDKTISLGEEVALEEYLVAGKWTLFEFRSDTCASCLALEPSVVAMAREMGVALRRIDITHGGPAVDQHSISATPTFVLYGPDGTLRLRTEGDLQPVKEAISGR